MERFENSEQQFESEIMSTQNLFTFPEAQPSEKVLNIREPPSIVDGEERYESSGKPMAGWIQPDAAFWPSAPSCSEGGLITHPPSNLQEINNVAVNLNLVPVSKLPPRYQPVFSQFPYFNVVQSRVFKDVFGTDCSLVVSAPTGSGKTVIMELAIIRLLMNQSDWLSSTKIIYMAPLKSIVAERFLDWKVRLGTLGVTCSEVTGDTEHDDLAVLGSSQVILTTPEKWDSLTRRWKDHANLMASISLFLIDEVHMLGDETRGPTLEAVVSRMKTLHTTRSWTAPIVVKPPRFIAISATIPNVEDVGAWLGNSDGPAITHKLEESLRPVQLKRVVLGFYCPDAWTDFRFDMMLSYKLPSVVATYCENKPTLVFVSTRKGAQQTATILIREARFIRNAEHKHFLILEANGLRDNKLRDCVLYGVGFHHAGVDMEDRQTIERLFLDGSLSVLVSTSTLAMGVNLPAHLVVIKSTSHYVNGSYQEYPATQILQMIGRAGRPQFHQHATAVILTKNQHKSKYEKLMAGKDVLESYLHLNLTEHLNAEVVLGTVTDLGVAVEWLRASFMYTRVQRNPRHYGIPVGLDIQAIERKLQDMCTREVNALGRAGLVSVGEMDLTPTDKGKLMARFCVTFPTMSTFTQLKGDESLRALIEMIAGCHEFRDMKLRTSDKKTLNSLNKSPTSTIRFPINGRIKTREQKISCLLQATLGCMAMNDPGLSQETTQIMRVGQRLAKCLAEYAYTLPHYDLCLNALLLAKAFLAKVWENSRFVARQLDKIGPVLAVALAHSNLTSFLAIERASPREIELICNRQPPFGNHIQDQARRVPKYEVSIKQVGEVLADESEVEVIVTLLNRDQLTKPPTTPRNHSVLLIVGDADNNLLVLQRISDTRLRNAGSVSRHVTVSQGTAGEEISISLVSETWVGLDVHTTYTPTYLDASPSVPQQQSRGEESEDEELPDLEAGPRDEMSDQLPPASGRVPRAHPSSAGKSANTSDMGSGKSRQPSGVEPGKLDGDRRACLHTCNNKAQCAHLCCKEGVVKKPNQPSAISDIKKRTAQFPDSCTGKRFKMSKPPGKPPSTPLTRFLYKCDKPKIQPSPRPCTSASFSVGPPSSGDPPSPNASPSSSRATSTTVVHSPAWALKTSTPGGQTSLSITSSSATVHPAPSFILTQPYNASKTPALPPPVKQFHNKEIDFGIEELFSDIFDEEMTQEDGMPCYNGQKFNEPNDQGRSMIHRKIYSSKPKENSLYTNTLGLHTNQKSAHDKENDIASLQSCTNSEHTNASTLKQGLQTPSKGKKNVCGGIGTPMKSQFTFSRRGKPADDSGYGSGIEQDERLITDEHRLNQNYKEDSADYFITGETKKFGKDEIQRQEKGNWMGTVEGCKAKEDNIGCEYPTASSYVNEYEDNVTADVHEGINIDEEQVEMQDEGFHLEQNLEAQNSCQFIPPHGFSHNVTNKSSQPYEQQCTQSLQSSQYAPETQLFQSHNQTTLGYPHQKVHDIPARSLTREQRFSCPSKAQMGPRFSNPTQLRQRLPRFQRPNCAPRLHPTFSQQLSSQQTHSDPILPGRFQHPFQTKENQVQFPCMQDLYCQNDTLQQEHHISSSRPQSQNSPLNQQSNCLGKQGPHYLQQPQWLRSRETFPKHQNYQVGQQSFPEERQPNPLSIRHPFSTQSEHNQLRPPVIGQRQHRPFFSQSQQQADFGQRPRRPLFNQRQRHPISSHLQPHINRIQQPMLSEQGRPRSSDFKRQPMFGQRHPEIPFTRRMQRPVFTSPQPLFRNRQNQLQSLQEIKKNCFHSLNAVDQVLQQTSDSEAHTNIQKFQSRVQTLGQRGQIETQNDPSGQECHFQPTIQQFPKESRIDLDSLLSEVQPEPFPSLNALVTDSDPFASTQQQVNTKEDTRHDTDFNRSFSEPVQHQQRKSQPRYPFGISKATLEEEWGNQIENEKAFDESFTDAPPSVDTGLVNCNVSGNTNVGNIVTNQEPPDQNFSFPIFPSTEQRINLDQIISATQDFSINQVKLNTGSVQSAERNTLHSFTPKLPSLAQLTTKQSSAIQPVTPQEYPLAQTSQTVSEYENSYKKWRKRFSPLTIPKGNGQFNESKSNSDFSSRSISCQSQDSDRESEWADLDLFQMCRQIEHGKLQSLYQPFKTRSSANAESIDQRKDKPTLLIHPSIKSPTSLSKSPAIEPNSHSPVVPNVNEGTKSLPVGTVTPRECDPLSSIDPKCHQEDSVRVEVLSGRNTLRDIHITLSRGQQCTPDIGKGSARNTNIVEGPNSV